MSIFISTYMFVTLMSVVEEWDLVVGGFCLDTTCDASVSFPPCISCLSYINRDEKG